MERTQTILVVEDDALMRGSLALAFRSVAGTVLEAGDGKEGLALALMKHPDLIILDVAMPGLDGISVMRALREDAWGKDARIILLTSLGNSDEVMKEVGRSNPAYCLVKTQVSVDDVVAKARQLLGLNQ